MTATCDAFENGGATSSTILDRRVRLLYIRTSSLRGSLLTVTTSGRTKVTSTSHTYAGTISYTMSPRNSVTTYYFRAYVCYLDDDGNRVYVYSSQRSAAYYQLYY